jgi:aspartyl/asparaginyl-tRNA synthetase
MKNLIDYTLIGKAVDLYDIKGYTYVETPWWVSTEALYSTMPMNITSFCIDTHKPGLRRSDDLPAGYLVGSAEQGLVQHMLDGALETGKYVAAGPCFRNEPIVDDLHLTSFFKVELMFYLSSSDVVNLSVDRLIYEVLIDARQTMEYLTRKAGRHTYIKTVNTDIGYDLTLNDIEVGSYGYRSYQGHHWVYGTGLALPRFHQALENVK